MSETIKELISFLRDREYMSGVDREKTRIKQRGEIFTPTPLVQEILDQLPEDVFKDPSKTFLDPSCGDGQFLSEVLIRKLEHGISLAQALSTIYGVDIMQDNVDLCRERLSCGHPEVEYIVRKNIVCANALEYDYGFGEKIGLSSFFE